MRERPSLEDSMTRLSMSPLAPVLTALALASEPAGAGAPVALVAEQVSVANAAERLFGGTDADGGIDDWYLSNGIVEVIVDDVGSQDSDPRDRPPQALRDPVAADPSPHACLPFHRLPSIYSRDVLVTPA